MISLNYLEAILSPEVVVGLADDDGDGQADASVIAQAAADAEGEVRQRLAGEVSLPDSDWPAHLVGIVGTLTIERLYERRREALPGPWAERCARARTILNEIAAGRRPIEGIATSARVRTTRGPDDRAFTSENLGRL
ncbi:DUF1320 domain-containing protein [bacterium]|nr:DUF1320 domain-containing protein [bacterium]